MPAIPINVVIKGIVIPGVSGFRYGQQLHDQQFFELRFRQPLLGSTLSLTDDPQSYIHQPITLQFETAFGKTRSVSASIVKLEFANTPFHNAEVILTGTMYQPSGKVSKFTLALFALLFIPCLFAGGMLWYVSGVSNELVKATGTISSLQDRAGKGTHHYTFKIAPYNASLQRTYHTPIFNTANDNISALEDGKGQAVVFYVFKDDLARLTAPREKITIFYLRSDERPYVKFDHYYDVLVYAGDRTVTYLAWLVCLFLEVLCFTIAFYCYKMYALHQQRNNRIIWFSCMVVAALLNIAILALVL